jgi:hypothetical protein
LISKPTGSHTRQQQESPGDQPVRLPFADRHVWCDTGRYLFRRPPQYIRRVHGHIPFLPPLMQPREFFSSNIIMISWI